ncbi:holin family protein [uncultured Anaerococcus sp.]|uniref:phage holin family protein n=1 Tax=uncultured Anaerococcus sp. TaxID=293428 RepID=UPI0026126E65|nr:phage holin family protein [uncultured Anaerococcus sp.]
MQNILTVIKRILSAIGAWLGYILGEVDGFLNALILMAVIDYITGLMVAVVEKKLSSRIGTKGIFKKLLMFMMVAIAHMVDKDILHTHEAIRTATIFFYLANEGLSIFENSLKLGLPVPDKLKDTFLQLQEREKKGDLNG